MHSKHVTFCNCKVPKSQQILKFVGLKDAKQRWHHKAQLCGLTWFKEIYPRRPRNSASSIEVHIA